MRKLVLLSGLLPCLLLLAGCPKKGGDADAAAEAAAPDPAEAGAAAPNAPPVPDAKNKADVARFQNETAISDDETKPANWVNARTSPKGGGVVANLKPGTDVHKHAEYQDCFLVTFADPKDDDFCSAASGVNGTTPFDGDNEAGVQAFNSANADTLTRP